TEDRERAVAGLTHMQFVAYGQRRARALDIDASRASGHLADGRDAPRGHAAATRNRQCSASGSAGGDCARVDPLARDPIDADGSARSLRISDEPLQTAHQAPVEDVECAAAGLAHGKFAEVDP